MPDPQVYQWARSVVIAAWQQETGQSPTIFQAQCVQALTRYETKWATTWKPPCTESHNWGSVHATQAQVNAGVPSCEYVDHYPDGKPYAQRFRVYASDVDGCRDVIKYMRRAAGPQLDAGTSTDDVWEALFWGRYYGASCPEAIKHWGDVAATTSFSRTGKPATTEAGQACDRECIRQGQDVAARVISEIATVLHETPAPRGAGPGPGDSSTVDGSPGLLLVLLFGGVGAYLLARSRR